jgi:3',5'-cyclic AMP phosphodiesterase CpdA
VTVLLQVSDPHFGTEHDGAVEALVALAHQMRPGLVVLSGDITQRARHRQFQAARRLLDRLPASAQLVIPGNHDIPLFNVFGRLWRPYAGFSRVFGTDLEPVHEDARLLVIGVNTTRPRRHKDGEISAAQVERVAARLQLAAATQLRVVVVHQPVAALEPSDVANLIHGRGAAIRAWADAGCDIILGGHIHLPYALALRTTYPELSREVWAVQAGTAVSTRVRGGIPNSVNFIHGETKAGSRACRLERWDYAAVERRFIRHSSQLLQLSEVATGSP